MHNLKEEAINLDKCSPAEDYEEWVKPERYGRNLDNTWIK